MTMTFSTNGVPRITFANDPSTGFYRMGMTDVKWGYDRIESEIKRWLENQIVHENFKSLKETVIENASNNLDVVELFEKYSLTGKKEWTCQQEIEV